MPKPALTSNKQSKSVSNSAAAPAHTAARTTRLIARRGRGRGRVDDSDGEVEREALSDDSADAHVDSDSADSDADEPLARGGRLESPHPLAPPTPESPHRRPPGASHSKAKHVHAPAIEASSSNGGAGTTSDLSAPVAQREWSPAAAGYAVDALMDWGSTAVDWSAENVPVVDFEDFAAGRAPLSPSVSSTKPLHGRGTYADRRAEDRDTRQAYLESLRTDPAFVPTVGTFWTHDDRLMDKSLRRMNNWNNRRAQRGFGRGRGAFGRSSVHHADESKLPPADRSTWVHDGFEELANDEPQIPSPSVRGRGGLFPRGRARGGFFRGGFVQSTTRYINSPTVHSASSDHAFSQSQRSVSTFERRVWFIMKPERSWTKQFDAFLFQDWSLRPRHNVGPGIRIKLPGNSTATSVRLPLDAGSSKTAETTTRPPLGQSIVVKLKPDLVSSTVDVTASTSQLRPDVAPYHPPTTRQQTQTTEGNWIWKAPPPPPSSEPPAPLPQPTATSHVPPPFTIERPSMTFAHPHPPPPIATAPAPTFHQSTPSPGDFSSPYGYPHPLPYANSGNGGYDGRPVYYPHPHHTPHPSMSMYGPPIPQPMHVQHNGVHYMPQPPMEYYHQPPPPPPHQPLAPVVDPETGRPFFTPARSRGRIEIRAPTEEDNSNKPKRPSTSRTSSTPDVPREAVRPSAVIDNSRGAHSSPQQYAPQGSYYYYYVPPEGYTYGTSVQYGAPYDVYPAPRPEHMAVYY